MTKRSFADAPDSGELKIVEQRSFEEVNGVLKGVARALVQHLVPLGAFKGEEYTASDLHGGKGRSLSINVGNNAGAWKDFSSGEGGADFISLWAACTSLPQREAKLEAERWLGLSSKAGGLLTSRSQPSPLATSPAPAFSTDDDPGWWKDPAVKRKYWTYQAASGRDFAMVFRFEHPRTGKKTIRPWNPETNLWESPPGDKRPLYRLPEILASDGIVLLVEGEKCADAGKEVKFLATTIMGGAQAIKKTDFSPLEGRRVVLWRDNDAAGSSWEEKCLDALREVNARAVHVVEIPADKIPKWDIADAEPDERKELVNKALGHNAAVTGKPQLKISEWTLDRFTGKAPPVKWLVREVFQLATPSILVAMGEIGKGMLMLDLALKVAGCEDQAGSVVHPPTAFGCTISTFGRVVIFSAEDSMAELHRRLEGLDPGERIRDKAKDRLIIVPLPDAGGAKPLIKSTSKGVETTDDFERIRDQLLGLEDLALVNFDPLSSFVQADLNKDGAAASFAFTTFASLSSETGAANIVTHHMRKATGNQGAVTSPEMARDAIRGQSGIVDGVRCAYALWPSGMDATKKTLIALRDTRREWRGSVVNGAVVKSNGPADRSVHTFIRDTRSGLLVDQSTPLRSFYDDQVNQYHITLANALGEAASVEVGKPFTQTGAGGVFSRQESLPAPFKTMSRHPLEKLVKELLALGKISKCSAPGSRLNKWLDVPGGPFSRGEGLWDIGAAPVGSDDEE